MLQQRSSTTRQTDNENNEKLIASWLFFARRILSLIFHSLFHFLCTDFCHCCCCSLTLHTLHVFTLYPLECALMKQSHSTVAFIPIKQKQKKQMKRRQKHAGRILFLKYFSFSDATSVSEMVICKFRAVSNCLIFIYSLWSDGDASDQKINVSPTSN